MMTQQDYKACIEECLKCMVACNHCYASCLEEDHMVGTNVNNMIMTIVRNVLRHVLPVPRYAVKWQPNH